MHRKRRLLCWLAVACGGIVLALVGAFLLRVGRPRTPPTPRQAWAELAGDLAPERMNVILITIDTLRADRLSCYGSRSVETPNIDGLAREGVRFTNAASTVPFTLPAHSSLMTGTYPLHHHVRENVGFILDESLPTLAERLADGGWTTVGLVSAFVLDSRWGIARGFDNFFDDFDLAEGQRANLGSVQRDGSETVAGAVRWLDSRPEGPFFLWLHLYDPHDPYTPPEPYKSRYPRNPYEAEVAYTDSLIGEFRQALDERGLLESSLLILTADHGEGLGQHREGYHGFFIYDSTMHVPLILRLPFGDFAGREVGAVVSHVDLLPTLLEATGQPIPEGVQGKSLLPLLLGFEAEEDQERAVYSESLYPLLHYGWAPLRSIRTRQFKFIDAPQPELYDLASDPGERQNILLDKRRTSRQMKDQLDAMRQRIESDARSSAQHAELDEETLEQLRALGYVAGRGGVAAEDEGERPRADPKERIELHQLVMAAQSDIGAGDLERAEQRLRQALATDPSIIEGHQMLGTVASQRERFSEAVRHFQAALALKSDLEPSLFGLARAYQEMGQLEEAMVGFRRFIDLEPEDPRATLAIVDIYLARNLVDQAMAELERATQWEKPPAIVFSRLGELLVQTGRAEEAEERFRSALERNAELAQPHFNLAVLVEERGDLDEAIALYERAVELAPAHYQAQFNLGRLYGVKGDLDRQQRLYEAALESNPEFIRGYYFLAKLLMERGGDLARAEELTRTGLEKDPEHRAGPLGYYLLADILNRTGRHREAARAVEAGRRVRAEQETSSGG